MRGSIRDVFIGWVLRVDWWEKFIIQNHKLVYNSSFWTGSRAIVRPKNWPGGVVLAEMKQDLHCGCLDC